MATSISPVFCTVEGTVNSVQDDSYIKRFKQTVFIYNS